MSRRQDGSTDTLTGGLLRAAAVSGLVTGLAAAAVGGAGAATASCLSLGGFFPLVQAARAPRSASRWC